MASRPLDLKGKSVLIDDLHEDEEEEEEILSPMPLAFYNPYDVDAFKEILSPTPLDFYNPLEEPHYNFNHVSKRKFGEDIGYFNISEEDDEGFENWDEVFRREELYCKNCWGPMSVRETNKEGPSLSSLPQGKRQRIDDVTGIVETEKEEVEEAFLAEPKKKDEN